MAFDEQLIQALEWRHIGPHRGGRVVAVAGDPAEAQTFYFGACAGGVWKTTDGGTYWENVSDGQINVAAIGAIAVAESDPNVVYVGTGEACIRLDVSHGDGVYRSTDGGTTWQHCGLDDTRHISRVRIDPRDPDRVYVAALGHAYGPNDERGIFRSVDGGRSWERVLFVSDRAGAADLALDPTNPRILYATIWEAQRYPWNMRSGGDDSGVYRSLDGGDSWERISQNPGFATEMLGRMGVAVSRSRPTRIFAVVEAGDGQGGLYRSDDRGESWTRVSKSRDLIGRAWYYCHVFVDPADAETVWVLNVGCWRSTDGGRNFDRVATPHGDNHDLWIDPADPRRMIEGNDGGACVSFNGAETWSTIYNQPTAQFYHLDIDSQFPYRVYGTQQDNSAISVPSRSRTAGIPYAESHQVGFSESGYIAVHPDDPDLVFAGATGSAPGGGGPIWAYDHRTRQSRLVTVSPEYFFGEAITDLTHRFPWTFPIAFSPHDSNVLYTTGECVFRSTDLGTSYEPISPDLTRNDPEKLQAAGGPIQLDTSGAETYCTLSVLVESPHEAGTIWVGSDDGLVHITRDGGRSWSDVTPAGVPEWSYISSIDVSAHDPATVYLAATRYRLDDLAPLVFKTSDYGATWTNIGGNLPSEATTRVLREDPTRAGLLYAGSERDLFVTFDDGASWQSLRRNMPAVPVYDLRVHGDDLVAATHGRGFWILDDLAPLRELTAATAGATAHLFTPEAAYRYGAPPRGTVVEGGKNYGGGGVAGSAFYERKDADGQTQRIFLDAGTNPPTGAVVYYLLAEEPAEAIELAFFDERGETIRTFRSDPEAKPSPDPDPGEGPKDPKLLTAPGLNRFVWDLRHEQATSVPGDRTTARAVVGPIAPPGSYQVRLTVGGESQARSFELLADPNVRATREDLDAQFEFLIRIRDRLSEANAAINRIRNIQRQVREWTHRAEADDTELDEAIAAVAQRVLDALDPIELALVQRDREFDADGLMQAAGLNQKLAAVASVVSSADAVPTRPSRDVFAALEERLDEQLAALDSVVEGDLAELNRLIGAGIAAAVDTVSAQPPAPE